MNDNSTGLKIWRLIFIFRPASTTDNLFGQIRYILYSVNFKEYENKNNCTTYKQMYPHLILLHLQISPGNPEKYPRKPPSDTVEPVNNPTPSNKAHQGVMTDRRHSLKRGDRLSKKERQTTASELGKSDKLRFVV
jgi:hypothetical protein